MKKIILYIAASIDQQIAESYGGLDWLAGFPNPDKTDYGHKALLAKVDTVIMGGRTYRELLNMDVIWPYPNQQTYVVSHHEWSTEKNISFITGNIIEAISELRNKTGKNIWLVGGGELASMLLSADLVDEMIITTFPFILGNGIPLFHDIQKESQWKLQNCMSYENGVVKSAYKKEIAPKHSQSYRIHGV